VILNITAYGKRRRSAERTPTGLAGKACGIRAIREKQSSTEAQEHVAQISLMRVIPIGRCHQVFDRCR
jgi:hypothetical protein